MSYLPKEEFIKKKQKEYYLNKYKTHNIAIKTKSKVINEIDDGFKNIYDACKYRIRSTLFKYNIKIKFSYDELLGCSREEFKNYILSILKENMTFKNFNEWEMDHIKPISSFNLNLEDELYNCFNYKNIQLLWKHDNRVKSNKY
jgi:hypothetical protein